MLKELVEYIVRQLVEEQSLVKVETKQEDTVLCIQVTVDSKDRGRIIGRDGQTVKAIKAFLGLIIPEKAHIVIDLVPASS